MDQNDLYLLLFRKHPNRRLHFQLILLQLYRNLQPRLTLQLLQLLLSLPQLYPLGIQCLTRSVE
jgi:hypothetical protein